MLTTSVPNNFHSSVTPLILWFYFFSLHPNFSLTLNLLTSLKTLHIQLLTFLKTLVLFQPYLPFSASVLHSHLWSKLLIFIFAVILLHCSSTASAKLKSSTSESWSQFPMVIFSLLTQSPSQYHCSRLKYFIYSYEHDL